MLNLKRMQGKRWDHPITTTEYAHVHGNTDKYKSNIFKKIYYLQQVDVMRFHYIVPVPVEVWE